MIWPFGRKPLEPSSVEELGALVQQGGHQIAHELAELSNGQLEISQEIGRLVSQCAGNSTDIRGLSHIVSGLADNLKETNRLLGKLVDLTPEELRPTPLPPPPIARIPRPPLVPRFDRER